MILAAQALEYKNLGRALDFLNRHRPANDSQPDLRGWEWRYLWEQCRSDELATLGKHDDLVASVAVSPDGQWIASGGHDGLLKLWELAPGAASGRSFTNLQFGSPVCSVAFSPDGRWLAALSWTNGFALFKAPRWDRGLTGANMEIRDWGGSLAFSSDGRLLAVGWRSVGPGCWCSPVPFAISVHPGRTQGGLDATHPHACRVRPFRRLGASLLFDVRSSGLPDDREKPNGAGSSNPGLLAGWNRSGGRLRR
jgi:hypothetical protein